MKILIVDSMHESFMPMLRELGFELDYFPEMDYKQALDCIGDYEGLIIRSKFAVDRTFIGQAKKLKFIGRAGAGLDLIDLPSCVNENIVVFSANEGNRVAVSEHLIGMLLSLFHKLNQADFEIKQGLWNREKNRGVELFGKTVGIIGYGNNGQETARRLSAFGCEVLVYDKYKHGYGNDLIHESTLQTIFEKADILSLHVPLTAETNQWVGADFINKFKKNIYICNISRGEIIVHKEMINGLKSGKVKGVCLDVLENEKLNKMSASQESNFKYLSSQENVLLSPHIAGWTNESYIKIAEVLRDKISRFLQNS